ncbi:MAG TPA: S-layer homology domain-containing protein [Anaerovoracaceae bacterium]|nr:S-layer homology domain-containing protein [Anaerovoracaceae bacterium]
MKRTNRSFRFVIVVLLVLSLTFPMTFNAYAVTDGSDGITSTTSNGLDQNSGGQTDLQSTGPAIQTTSPAIETTLPAVTTDVVRPAAIESPGNIFKKVEKSDASAMSLLARAIPANLQINSVMVVNGGEEQARNRDYVYYDEYADSYFTDHRNASMTDERVFNISAVYTFEDFGISSWDELNTDDMIFTYGGKPWYEWRSYNTTTGAFDLDEVIGWNGEISNPAGDIIVVKVDVTFDEFYPYFEDYTLNLPYEGFTPIKKEGYPVFLSDPSMLGPHDLGLVYEDNSVDSIGIPLNLYDSFHTWDQIDSYAKDLKAESDSSGNMINGKYVAVKSLAQSQVGRDIWNVVIAKDGPSVQDYLTVTKPKLAENPNALLEEIDNPSALETGFHKSVIYFNNVHPDEVPASDAIMGLIDTLINGDSLTFDIQADAEHHKRTPGDYDGYTAQGEDNITEPVEFTVDELLDQYILVFNITENPDGKDNLLRTNEYGFDLNRDAAYQTQNESTALTADMVKWDPMAMLEYHGYVDGLLIEPCTGPHDPNYEYDLYAEKMLNQGNTIGKAMIGNTAYTQYLVPATDYSDGWDDGAPVYGPMFAMLYGTMGYTLEIPYATEDSKEACFSGGLALMNDCLENRSDYYQNMIEYKLRGINNEDNPNVDEYLTDPYNPESEPLGRPREEGKSFFPEYYVIPVDESYQKNPLEAYKTLAFLERNGAKISVTTEEVGYDEEMLPIGTYVIDMHQANRGFVNSMLSDGYDASNFKDIYAELVISYPDMRNFDCLTIWDEGLFSEKTIAVIDIPHPVTMIEGTSEKVVIQNDNIDVIKLVNNLLDNEKPVQMLTKEFGAYSRGDFVVKRADLEAYDTGLLVYGAPLEGTPIFIETIEEPDITILGSKSHSRFILDMLGFDGDYTFASNTGSVDLGNTDVLVGFNSNANVSSIVSGSGIGFIGIGTSTMNAAKTTGLLPGFDCFIPKPRTTETYREGLVESYYTYDNLVTANYDQTDTGYVMNGTYITTAPTNGEPLITVSSDENFFKAGWYPEHEVLMDNMLAVYGYSGSDEDVPVTLFANNIFSKAHAQHTFNMFANAVYLISSDIELDNSRPFINATPGSQTALVNPLTVTIDYEADREAVSGKLVNENTVEKSKYRISTSPEEIVYGEDGDWLDYTSTTSITLTTTGAFFIHAYAENSFGLNTQKVFGPYNIGTPAPGNTGNGGSHGGGGSSSTPAVTSPAISFTDINGHWAKTSIEYVVGKSLFSGVSDKLFAPDSTMTRGMLVTVLGRAYGLNAASYTQKSPFTDVPQSAYYAPYVTWAYENKIVSGTGDGLFAPDKPVTRGEMATIITNYMKYIGKGTQGTSALNYADAAEISSWGLEGVQFVTANGLMTGIDENNFGFDGLSTRAQVATVMERLMKLIGL